MMVVKLEIIKGPDRGQVFIATTTQPNTYLAGRNKDVRFRFSDGDPYISRRHFILEVAPPKVYFKDLDVTNPSRINDLYVQEAELRDGDVIEVGYTHLKVTLSFDTGQHKVRCQGCGVELEISEGEDNVQLCDACHRARMVVQRKPAPAQYRVTCFRCDKDLSEKGNRDGRAAELGSRVKYCCPGCLPSGDKTGGTKIGDYRTVKRLGEGGMGEVYLGYQENTARLVAIKQMNIDDKMASARFNREIRLLQSVSHDNVLGYIDHGQHERTGKPYLVIEFAPKGSLNGLLESQNEPLSMKQACEFMVQILNGLEHIHSHSIVHRDMKPENILLGQNEQADLVLKISDFGLAKAYSNAGGTRLTKLGAQMGTIFYMAQEQFEDAGSVKEPADIYSTGATLYYMLTQKYPFDFPTPLDIRRFIREHNLDPADTTKALGMMLAQLKLPPPQQIVLNNDPVPILKRNPRIPPGLAAVVDKTLLKRPEQRYQKAADFRSALLQAMQLL
jgi:serine/threonine-protein kinase